jgi:glycosyltransferase involved in cell wall biosynthesis
MRVLISVQNYHPAYSFGGRVTNAVALAEGLQALGHEVSVVTSSVVHRDNSSSWKTITASVNGVQVTYLGTWSEIGRSSLNPGVLQFAFSEVSRFEAIHIIGLYDALGPAIASAARRAKVPYSVEPSGMLIPIVRSLRIKRLYHTLFGDRMLKGARAIVATSKAEWREVLEFGISAEKVVIRRNGVNLHEYKALPDRGSFRRRFGIADEGPLILWLGRIEAIKNLVQLIEALAGLKHLVWSLAIVGPSESSAYLSTLQQLVSEHEMQKRVHFIDGLYDRDKLAAFADADFFALVSINENWGNTVQEAITAGLPILVTDTCGVADFVEGRAGVVVECNVAAIRSGIEKLLIDSDFYRTIKSKLPGIAADLSWDQPVHEMSELFQSWQSHVL